MSKRIIGFFVVIVLVLAAVVLWSHRQRDADQITIGLVQPLTGNIAIAGIRIRNGVSLAVDAHNSLQDVRRVAIIAEDSQGSPTEAAKALLKLIQIDKVDIVIGDLTSTAFLAMAPIAQRHRVFLISPTASNPKITEAGDFIYRIWPSDIADANIAATYMYRELDMSTTAIIYIQNDYGIGLARAFRAIYEELGGRVTHEEAFSEGQSDFRVLITKLKSKGVEAVYLPGRPREMKRGRSRMALS